MVDLRATKQGDLVEFGNYKGEPIVWRVMRERGTQRLLVTDKAIEGIPYNHEWKPVTWDESDMRKWLNGEFMDEAFNAEERDIILMTYNINKGNGQYDTEFGKNTEDYIYLLSTDDAKMYFVSKKDRQCEVTEYAKANGVFVGANGYTWWRLRTPGDFGGYTACVDYDGVISSQGSLVMNAEIGVRPAMWVNP